MEPGSIHSYTKATLVARVWLSLGQGALPLGQPLSFSFGLLSSESPCSFKDLSTVSPIIAQRVAGSIPPLVLPLVCFVVTFHFCPEGTPTPRLTSHWWLFYCNFQLLITHFTLENPTSALPVVPAVYMFQTGNSAIPGIMLFITECLSQSVHMGDPHV